MSITRPYQVIDKAGTVRLVIASSQAQARSHVVKDAYTVEVASANDVLMLLSSGIKAETARDESLNFPTSTVSLNELFEHMKSSIAPETAGMDKEEKQ